jgi:hypothetical protein
MRPSARLNFAVSLVAISFAAACSDSTGPKAPTSAQLAAHFDSIAIAAQAQSETNQAYSGRVLLASLIELPAALGAKPSSVNVTTANGVESWKAYEVLDVPSSSSSSDSTFFLLAFRDADAHTALLVIFDGSGAGEDGGIITGDTISVSPSDASATTTLSSVTSACTTPSSSLLNPQLAQVTFDTCNLASFTTSLNITSPTTTGMDAALTSVSFSHVSLNGVRVVDQAQGASLRRAAAMLRAMKASRHH